MNESYSKKIEALAIAISNFQSLKQEEQKLLKPLLFPGVLKTLKMIELISEKAMTYEEIAIELGQNECTVKQKLNALLKGGYPITLTEKTASAQTGRPRNLARKK